MLLKKDKENCKLTQYHLGYTIKHTTVGLDTLCLNIWV